MFIDTNISLTESDDKGGRGLGREGGTPGCSKNSAKFEI